MPTGIPTQVKRRPMWQQQSDFSSIVLFFSLSLFYLHYCAIPCSMEHAEKTNADNLYVENRNIFNKMYYFIRLICYLRELGNQAMLVFVIIASIVLAQYLCCWWLAIPHWLVINDVDDVKMIAKKYIVLGTDNNYSYSFLGGKSIQKKKIIPKSQFQNESLSTHSRHNLPIAKTITFDIKVRATWKPFR